MRLIIVILITITACAASHPPRGGGNGNSVVSNHFDYEVDSVSIFLIEQSVNSDELKQYYHFEIPERESVELVLNTSSPLSNVSIECFGRQMKILRTGDGLKSKRALELSEIDRNRSEAFLKFRYAIEGISFKVAFENVNQQWIKRSITIVEN